MLEEQRRKVSGSSTSWTRDANDGVAEKSEVALKVKVGKAQIAQMLWRKREQKRGHIRAVLSRIREVTAVVSTGANLLC